MKTSEAVLLKRQLKSIKRKRDGLKEEVRRHMEAVEVYQKTLLYYRRGSGGYTPAYEALKKGEAILSGEKAATEAKQP